MPNTHLESFLENTRNQDQSPQSLKAAWFNTQLGSMMAIADDNGLYFLDFADGSNINRGVKRLKQRLHLPIIRGQSSILRLIEDELIAYFKGTLEQFSTPVVFLGSPFQRRVWEALREIPYGETYSYAEVAKKIGMPSAFRAVANANGANPVAIVVPCHRVIRSNGHLGGYGGGVTRKNGLINHERRKICI